jgi:arylsulfatase A-like enzyme/tetratricopeptide (TPR) repeat protein
MFVRSRTAAIVAAAAIALGSVVWVVTSQRPGASFDRRPDQNILLITIDTLRGDALSTYGGVARTPNLDALASRGTRFDFAHAHAVLTRPSHASILTGTYPYENGVRDHSGYRLKAGTQTIASLLKDRGFATGAFVGGVPLERRFGLDGGFDVYDDRFGRTGNNSDFTLAERPAGEVVDAALQWIGGRQGRWFAWVHVFDPHAPYAPPPPFDTEYAGRPYYGEVAYVDKALGPLLDAAARSSRPTTVVVTSDHGEGLGDHGELTHGLLAYETTLRVPLIIAQLEAGSGKPEAGSRKRVAGSISNYPARHVDLLPTVLDAVGLTAPPPLPGRSLLPGAARPPDEDVSSYFEAMSAMLNRGWAPLQGVIAGREKYVDLPKPELYDLAADPKEETNLVDRKAERRRVLEVRLRDFHAAPPGDRFAESPEVAAKLQSLGYTSGSAPRKAKYGEEDDPKNLMELDRWIQQGIEAWQHGNRPEALETYERIIQRRPSMAIGYRNLAFLQWQNGDARGAIKTLERAFRADAIEPGMTTQLGSYLAEAGRPADAIALLEPIAAGTPADPDALNALGIAYARGGQAERSAAVFRRALDENPSNVQALENIGTLEMQRGNLIDAKHALELAVAIDPRSARAHNGLGVAAMHAGARDEAFAHWKRAVELAPNDFDTLFNLGTELDAAGRHAEARPFLEKFAREAPSSQYAPDIAKVRKLLSK